MATLLLKGQPIGTVDGVLFDKDGTLCHSEPYLLDLFERRVSVIRDLWIQYKGSSNLDQLEITLRKAFGLRGGALHPGGTLAVATRQDNLISTATILCIFGSSWPEAIALANICFKQVDQQHDNGGDSRRLLTGAKALLEKLARASIQNAVISNDTTVAIQAFLRNQDINSLIVDCWSADNRPRKPDPNAVRQLCTRLNLAPYQCALIGDAETDLEMAKGAGIGCIIGYFGGWQLNPDLPSAIHRLDHWNELDLEADL
ncbi:HAD-IA family hydrolase [Synechococcus sp. M16CYN]|uniref:HAD family hydrolase n=1 Tax=Synechococcus sp. M16CYN TaxID=3103139 RepID=UPI00324908F4